MHLSIRFWTILLLNVFVLGLTFTLGWVAQDVAGRVVEERFTREMVYGVTGFFKDKQLPPNDTMMHYLREMFHAHWITSKGTVGNIVASSLPEKQTQQFRQHIGAIGTSGVIALGDAPYRVDAADIVLPDYPSGRNVTYRLYMLVPYSQFQETRRQASQRIAQVVFPAAIIVTILAIILAFIVTRPIRKLAGQMDTLAAQSSASDPSLPALAPIRGGLKETAQLMTSFHRLLERLTATRQQLAQNERLATLGKVSLSVAHELRNPLSGIKMNVRLLKDQCHAAEHPEIETVLREIERMELYLNELMSLAPGNECSQPPLNYKPVKLSEQADSVLAILSGRCRHADIAVQQNYSPVEPTIQADPNLLRQAMMNLMVNAIEAMPNGGTMALSIAVVPAGLRFSVADTGGGVSGHDQDVFNAFVTNKPNGVGLGLYLCRQIITRHNGKIAYNNTRHGAAFWFDLPLPDKFPVDKKDACGP